MFGELDRMAEPQAVLGEVEWDLEVAPVDVAVAQTLEVYQVSEVADLKGQQQPSAALQSEILSWNWCFSRENCRVPVQAHNSFLDQRLFLQEPRVHPVFSHPDLNFFDIGFG